MGTWYVKTSPSVHVSQKISFRPGGTCVNVGCIPKKLYHAGSLLRESIHADGPAFGFSFGDSSNGELVAPTTNVQWETLRENIQNYIRSLNFKYRVSLREKNVKYCTYTVVVSIQLYVFSQPCRSRHSE